MDAIVILELQQWIQVLRARDENTQTLKRAVQVHDNGASSPVLTTLSISHIPIQWLLIGSKKASWEKLDLPWLCEQITDWHNQKAEQLP